MFKLNHHFAGLKEIEKPIFEKEWNDSQWNLVHNTIEKFFKGKTLQDHRGQYKRLSNMESIEDFFGLPYTSSSSFAMISNTNTMYHIDIEKQYNISYFALTNNNEVVLIAEDNNENEKYYILEV
jgi:hypothetical protein